MASLRPSAELRKFFLRLLWAVPVATLLWGIFLGFYTPALCWSTQELARLTENPPAAQIVRDGHRAILGRTDLRADSARLRISLIQIHSNLVPFLALALALPGRRDKDWWSGLVIALSVLVASHIVALMLNLKWFYAFSLGPWSQANYTEAQRNFYATARYFFDLPVTYTLPLLLWVTLFTDRVAGLIGVSSKEQPEQLGKQRH